MKIFVTGGCGYIGSHTVLQLIQEGNEVVVFDNLETSNETSLDNIEALTEHRPQFIKGDLKNPDDISKALTGDINCVIHFAALKSVVESKKDPFKYFENNVIGTFNLLKAMMEKNVPNIVFSSSAAVYGNPQYLPVDEEHPLNPLVPYATNKVCMEYMLKDFFNVGINSVALRYFNASGADESGRLGEDPSQLGNFIPRVFKASIGEYSLAARGQNLDTRDGSAVRDYVHVSDLADGHIKAVNWLLKKRKACEVFNLCSGEGSTVLEVINAVKEITGRDFEYKVEDLEEGEATILTGSYKKAEKVLGWKPTRSLNTIITDTYRWYKNN